MCSKGDLETRGYLDATRRLRILTGRIVGERPNPIMVKIDRRSVGYQAEDPAEYQRKLAESWLHTAQNYKQ